MQPSMFNVRVPLDTVADRSDVFLMNTFSDAQVIVSTDVAALLDRLTADSPGAFTRLEREAIDTLTEHGFIVPDRASERQRLESFFQGEPGEVTFHGLISRIKHVAGDFKF